MREARHQGSPPALHQGWRTDHLRQSSKSASPPPVSAVTEQQKTLLICGRSVKAIVIRSNYCLHRQPNVNKWVQQFPIYLFNCLLNIGLTKPHITCQRGSKLITKFKVHSNLLQVPFKYLNFKFLTASKHEEYEHSNSIQTWRIRTFILKKRTF